jgi:hypothetical protein
LMHSDRIAVALGYALERNSVIFNRPSHRDETHASFEM